MKGEYQQQVYWNTRTYGKALIVPAWKVRTGFVILCLLTPATNWLIPLAKRLGKLVVRYE